jgi:hypothetical protein
VADARLSATMDAVGMAASTQKGVLVQSRSVGPLYEPPGNFMQPAPGGGGGGCDGQDGGCEDYGWSDGDGSSMYGYAVTQNQTQPPAQPGDPS